MAQQDLSANCFVNDLIRAVVLRSYLACGPLMAREPLKGLTC